MKINFNNFALILMVLMFANFVCAEDLTIFKKKSTSLPFSGKAICKQGAEPIKIPCSGNFGGYGKCKYKSLMVEPYDTSVKDYLSTLSETERKSLEGRYSLDGYSMDWELADKVCKSKNMRLPKAVELHFMYKAEQNGLGCPFLYVNYWAEDIGNDFAHNCHMRLGNCGRHKKEDLQRVRCVEN